MINLKVDKNLLSITIYNEISDLNEIIKKRTKGDEIEPWVVDLIKRRDELIYIRNNIEKSVQKSVTIKIEDTLIL